VDHQIEDLTRLRLKLETFRIRRHGKKCNEASPNDQDGRLRVEPNRDRAKPRLMRKPPDFHRYINQVDVWRSRYFQFFRRLPAFKISAQDKKFTADLNYPNTLFLNDSAEMPH
jgi:hypothetical protein